MGFKEDAIGGIRWTSVSTLFLLWYYKQNCLRTYGRTRQNKSVRQYGNIG